MKGSPQNGNAHSIEHYKRDGKARWQWIRRIFRRVNCFDGVEKEKIVSELKKDSKVKHVEAHELQDYGVVSVSLQLKSKGDEGLGVANEAGKFLLAQAEQHKWSLLEIREGAFVSYIRTGRNRTVATWSVKGVAKFFVHSSATGGTYQYIIYI